MREKHVLLILSLQELPRSRNSAARLNALNVALCADLISRPYLLLSVVSRLIGSSPTPVPLSPVPGCSLEDSHRLVPVH